MFDLIAKTDLRPWQVLPIKREIRLYLHLPYSNSSGPDSYVILTLTDYLNSPALNERAA